MKELRQFYGGRKPKSYLLAHNHITHTPDSPLGANGFRRFWIPPQWIGQGWNACPCGWRSDLGTHYANSDHVGWWKEEIKKGALRAYRVGARRLVVTEAAWRLSEDLPCDVEVATARLWAADTGHTVAHTTVHVHGGVGIDLDGAAHRYFTAAKRTEITLGGTTLQARQVGQALAAEPV